jgi:hypothetical protein
MWCVAQVQVDSNQRGDLNLDGWSIVLRIDKTVEKEMGR